MLTGGLGFGTPCGTCPPMVCRPLPQQALLSWLTDEEVRQEITAQHVLIRPARGEMKLFVPRWLVDAPSRYS